MRHFLGILVATATLLVAAGCGTNSADTASDASADPSTDQPTGQPTDEPTDKPSGHPAADVVAILSASAAGGVPSKAAIDVGNPVGLDRLVSGLGRQGLGNEVRAKVAATDIPDGHRLLGSIVNVGCDTPTGVSVTSSADSLVLVPTFTGTPLPECLVAVTSIALVLVEVME